MNNQKSAPLMNENIKAKNNGIVTSHFARYDEALKNFIKEFFVGDVVIAPNTEFWEFYIKNQKTEGKEIRFPAISLYPVNYSLNSDQNNFASIQLGSMIQRAVEIRDEATNEKQGNTLYLSKSARVLWFDIDYQINIWALKREEALQLVQEMLFPLYQHKELPIIYFNQEYSVPYQIDGNIVNNSTIGMNANPGTMYIYTINLTLSAPIFDSKNYYNVVNRDLKLFTYLGEEET